ncbi:MAG: DUF927 domain-containing protein [Desulfovibrio sp.]
MNDDEQSVECQVRAYASKPKTFLVDVLKNESVMESLQQMQSNNPRNLEIILSSLNQSGVTKTDIKQLSRTIKQSMALAKNLYSRMAVKSVLNDAPVSQTAVMPYGYLLRTDGVIQKVSSQENAGNAYISCPVFIIEIKVDKDTSLVFVKLAWKMADRWSSLNVEKLSIASRSKIVELANVGVPVTSGNADVLVDYLLQYELANHNAIARVDTTNRLGWVDGGHGFMWGQSYLTSASVGQGASQGSSIQFQGRDRGDEQFAAGFIAKGQLEAWAALVNDVLEYPQVAFLVYTALTPPLLRIFGVENFTLELSNPSSSGKTTALLLAASAWGIPDMKANSFVNTWGATETWIERAASLFMGLPLFLDETKLARTKGNRGSSTSNLVSETLYLISSGQGKGRGTLTGLGKTDRFETILFTTGETPSLELSSDGGTRGRMIDLWGMPFGRADGESRKLVERVRAVIADNYGHAGPRLVQFILDNRDSWPLWKDAYLEAKDQLASHEGMSAIEIRLTEYFAAVATAIPIVHAALPVLRRDLPVRELLDSVWRVARNEASSADIVTKALRLICDWMISNEGNIYSPELASQGISWGSQYGAYWDQSSTQSWTFIGFTGEMLRKLFTQNELKLTEVARNMSSKGLLVSDGTSKGYQKQVSIPGSSSGYTANKLNLYCLKREILVSTMLSKV